MYCEKCGKQLGDDVAFCSGCGQPIQQVEAEAPDEQPMVEPDASPASPVEATIEAPEQEAQPQRKTNRLMPLLIAVPVVLLLLGIGVYLYVANYTFLLLRPADCLPSKSGLRWRLSSVTTQSDGTTNRTDTEIYLTSKYQQNTETCAFTFIPEKSVAPLMKAEKSFVSYDFLMISGPIRLPDFALVSFPLTDEPWSYDRAIDAYDPNVHPKFEHSKIYNSFVKVRIGGKPYRAICTNIQADLTVTFPGTFMQSPQGVPLDIQYYTVPHYGVVALKKTQDNGIGRLLFCPQFEYSPLSGYKTLKKPLDVQIPG